MIKWRVETGDKPFQIGCNSRIYISKAGIPESEVQSWPISVQFTSEHRYHYEQKDIFG